MSCQSHAASVYKLSFWTRRSENWKKISTSIFYSWLHSVNIFLQVLPLKFNSEAFLPRLETRLDFTPIFPGLSWWFISVLKPKLWLTSDPGFMTWSQIQTHFDGNHESNCKFTWTIPPGKHHCSTASSSLHTQSARSYNTVNLFKSSESVGWYFLIYI